MRVQRVLGLLSLALVACDGSSTQRARPDDDCDACDGEPDGGLGAPLDGGLIVDAARSDATIIIARDGGADAAQAMTWPTGPIRPTRHRLPEPSPSAPPCPTGGNGQIAAHQVLLGQTHLTPPGWPFQTLSGNRPLTVALAVAGSGAAPAFKVSAKLAGRTLEACLTGPSSLPASATDLSKSLFRATLPSSFTAPGVELTLEGGGIRETLRPDVKAESGLTLYYVQARLFDTGTEETPPSAAHWGELLARLPVSYLDVGVNPFGVWQPSKLLLDARSDGTTPSGAKTSHPALVIAENPHCTQADKTAGTCTVHSGYGVMAGVLSALDAFRSANGVAGSSTWYADLAVALGGGLAGGQRGTGDNALLVMNHELGHAWGFPHWSTSDVAYPYEGVRSGVSGGFGDRWALDQRRDLLLSTLCEGSERQSPLQRSGASCVPDGSFYDPYSDYEAMRLLRMTLGAPAAASGTVAYLGGKPMLGLGATRAYTLPKEGGRPLLSFRDDAHGFTLARYDATTNRFTVYEPEGWQRVVEAEVPVTMFAGALIYGGASFFEPPVDYVGNVLAPLDPTDATDFAYLRAHKSDDFYWSHDVVLRFTLDDQTRFTRLLAGGGDLRKDGDTLRFAINLPSATGQRVTKLEVLSRPLGHWDASSRLASDTTPASYLAKATVLATWQR